MLSVHSGKQSLQAIFSGYLVLAIPLAVIGAALTDNTFNLPPGWLAAGWKGIVFIFGLAGGCTAAAQAGSSALKHSIILATVAGLISVAVNLYRTNEFTFWADLVLMIAGIVFGGYITGKRRSAVKNSA